MSKPRWIDSGVFKTLRNATRTRTLAVVVGPQHGGAALSSLAQAKEALAGADRTTLSEQAGCQAQVDKGLATLYALKQGGVATTSVSDAMVKAAPEGQSVRIFGPDSKGLKGAWERKEPFVVHLKGYASEPSTLLLTGKDRKPLAVPDSRYQSFLRVTFARTVLFTGFALDDPDLNELLEDVSRVYSGHVPPNVALVPAGTTDPSTALRASMHYGMSIVEFPAEMGVEAALAELAGMLEELEIPKPATGNPPTGFTELTQECRDAVPAAAADLLDRFDRGDSSSWITVKAAADATRTAAAELKAFLTGAADEGKVPLVLVRGELGQGKTTLLRRVAWELAEQGGPRVFWREFGVDVPDRYVPAEADDAQAVFVADDADELDNLPQLLKHLAANGKGKARLLLAADTTEWDRSGLDHRIRQDAQIHELTLGTPDEAECLAIAEGLSSRKRLADGLAVDAAAKSMAGAEGSLMDRIASARGVGSISEAVSRRIDALAGDDLHSRAYLAVSTVHRYGMSLSRKHLAGLLGLPEGELEAKVLTPLAHSLIPVGPTAVRTRHPLVAEAVCGLLAKDDAARDTIVEDLLKTLPGGSVSDNSVFHEPSELIRRVRMSPLAPLAVGRFFEAGENAADNDGHFWYDRGRFEFDFSRWEPALHFFDRALWRRPGDSTQKGHNAAVQSYRARCLLNLKRRKEAVSAVEEGLRLSSRDAVLLRLKEKLGGRRGGPAGRRGGDRRGGRGGDGKGRPGDRKSGAGRGAPAGRGPPRA